MNGANRVRPAAAMTTPFTTKAIWACKLRSRQSGRPEPVAPEE